ncbi:MAG: hypothetical protein EOM40_13470 [Clostridia bacterium]|nr:hypothetical protein [Clostridia bacterium]
MDKTEYRMKLDEINRLVEAQDYEGALSITDSIDWRRVKSVRTLCMVADIYEVNGELDESMKMLQYAYKRSSVGKMILYRQVELSLKMGNYDEAVKYYNQYLETASNDTSKYILKYKIYKAQNAPLDEQIAILEEYKDREYTERWVYELARLYKRAGKQDKCVETCDDLILWFGEGKYVTKAMELKMTYVPLTASQKTKYDQRKPEASKAESVKPKHVTADTVAGISAAAMANLQRVSEDRSQEEDKSQLSSGSMAGAAEAAATGEAEKTDPTPSVEEPQIHVDTAQLQERLAKSFQEVLSGFNRTKVVNAFEALGRATGDEMPPEPEVEENIEEYQVSDLEPEMANEAKISAEKGEAIAHRTVNPVVDDPAAKKEEKPEDKEITNLQDVDLEALFAETSSLLAKEAGGGLEESNVEDAEDEMPEFIEPEAAQDENVEAETEAKEETKEPEVDVEILAKEIEADEAAGEERAEAEVQEAVADSEPVISMEEDTTDTEPEIQPEEKPVDEGIESENNMMIDDDFLPQIDMSIVDEIQREKEAEIEGTENVGSEPEESDIEEAPAEMTEAAEPAEAVVEDISLDIVNDVTEDREPAVSEDAVPEADLFEEEIIKIAPAPGDTQEFNLEEQLLAAISGSADKEETSEEDEMDIAAELFQEADAEAKDESKSDAVDPGDMPEEDFLPQLDMDIVMELQQEKENPAAVHAPEELSGTAEESETEENAEAEAAEIDETPEVNHVDIMMAEAEAEIEMPSVIPEKETPEEKRIRILNATRPERLTEEQKNLFSYFAKVPGMDDQILEAINGAYQFADDKTSRRGNIAIMGSHGTGKTRLSEGLVKAICKELGLEAVKYANLDASDMNRKDPVTVIGKMSGGFLLIERASFMSAETIEKLSKAMDFRTDSMILLIEDDKVNMRKLLAEYPEFASKFETTISIPVFTNDELVTFARTYARENGYRMDEMGVLALYTLIGDNQREDEPITIGKVKEMVDGAIQKASGSRLGRKISKRHTDDDGRILLYEKDFDL